MFYIKSLYWHHMLCYLPNKDLCLGCNLLTWMFGKYISRRHNTKFIVYIVIQYLNWKKWHNVWNVGPYKQHIDFYLLGYLDWFRSSYKTAPWPSRGLQHFGKSLSPRMSELVEDAVASWCGDIVGHFWLIRNELQKCVEFKFEIFSFNTFDVSHIYFWQSVVQPRPK